MRRTLSTPRRLLEIQANDLRNWHAVLKPAAYAALESRAHARRRVRLDLDCEEPVDEMEDIVRGEGLRQILSEIMGEFRN